MEDLVDGAQKSGVDWIGWKAESEEGGEQDGRMAKMAVVRADVGSTQQFTVYGEGLRAQGQLDGMFVDECHTMVMDVGYGRELEGLKGLDGYDYAVVLLTARLRRRMERWFRQSMVVTDGRMIGGGTTKRKIRYKVGRVCRATRCKIRWYGWY
jgi:hypothetical protein